MTEDWALLLSIFIILTSMSAIMFYLIPMQTRIALQEKSWLTGLRWILVSMSASTVLLFVPSLSYRILRYFGVESVLLANTAAISTALAFLVLTAAFISLYHYKRRD